jgi:hypothetical protein
VANISEEEIGTVPFPDDDKTDQARRYALNKQGDSVHSGVGYIEFIEFLSRELRPRSYFEVGTRMGDSVGRVNCDAICIDPDFTLVGDVMNKRRKLFLFQMTSDEFFADHRVDDLFPAGIDLAFLDGLHRFEFLLRDFINTERFCHRSSIILLHDCLPYRERISSRLHRQPEDEWTGDVWKILPILKKYRPDLKVTMFDCPPTGIIACSNLSPTSTVLADAFLDIVEEYLLIPDEHPDLPALNSIYPLMDTRQILSKPEDLSAILPFACQPRSRQPR